MITASLVLYHNSQKDVDTVLNSVLNSPVERLFIVDNSSNDDFKVLEERSERIKYFHNDNNIGYGGAHNIAIREAIKMGAKYHVIVNPDIYFEKGIIEQLSEYADTDESIGWVMPRVVYPDGELQYLCKPLPTPMDLIFRRFVPQNWFKKSKERFELRHFGYDKELNVPFLSGCFIFLRLAAIENVGGFDEHFFMYGEDIDLSRRVHSQYKTMFYPNVTIVHAHMKASYKNRKMLKVHIMSIVKYFNKWGWLFDSERRRVNKELMNSIKALNEGR